jgi:hypothetical protein
MSISWYIVAGDELGSVTGVARQIENNLELKCSDR